MPDYDVGAVGLSQPPNPGSVTAYRPAIRVHNYGIHDALAVGYIRIYKDGALIYSSEVYSGTITPDDEKDAQALTYWTPPAQGTYIVQGYVSCDLDQNPANNPLQPVSLVIGAEPPPPPPPVEAHAAQHEEDGSDEVNVDGLQGKLSDPQTAAPHGADHEAGGDDELVVDGLHGVLADGQPVAAHGNEKHTSEFLTSSDLADHNTSGTAHNTILQQLAQKGMANGYCPLDASAKVPLANLHPTPGVISLGTWSACDDTMPETEVIGKDYAAFEIGMGSVFRIRAFFALGASIATSFRFRAGTSTGGVPTAAADISFSVAPIVSATMLVELEMMLFFDINPSPAFTMMTGTGVVHYQLSTGGSVSTEQARTANYQTCNVEEAHRVYLSAQVTSGTGYCLFRGAVIEQVRLIAGS